MKENSLKRTAPVVRMHENGLLFLGIAMLLWSANLAFAKETVTGAEARGPLETERSAKAGAETAESAIKSGETTKRAVIGRQEGAKELRVEPKGPGRRDSMGRIVIEPHPGFDVDIWTDRTLYRDGDLIRISFRATRDAYVYIFDTDTNGVTRQIFPNYHDRDHFVRGRVTYRIPDRNYNLRVTGPSGRERLEIVAVSDRRYCIDLYERYRGDAPYPIRKGGANEYLRRLDAGERRGERDRVKSPVERNRSRAVEEYGLQRGKSAEGSARYRRTPEWRAPERRSIVIVPPRPHEPARTARAVTTFQVRGSGPWYGEPRGPWRIERDVRLGKLKIGSSPKYAEIYIDGDYVGVTNKNVELPLGRHEIRLEKRGYYAETRIVWVADGPRRDIEIDLRPIRRR